MTEIPDKLSVAFNLEKKIKYTGEEPCHYISLKVNELETPLKKFDYKKSDDGKETTLLIIFSS